MGTSLDDFLTKELSRERVAEVVDAKALDPVVLVERHLFDGRLFLRRNAACALSLMGPITADNLHWVIVAAKDSDPLVREQTVAALPAIGLAPDAASDALMNALADRDTSVSEAAQSALEQLTLAQADEMAPRLIAQLTARPPVARTAQDLLLRIAPQAAPLLAAGCASEDMSLAIACVDTLKGLGVSAQGAMIGATSLQGAGPASPMSAFSASTPYAPSTLLGGAPR